MSPLGLTHLSTCYKNGYNMELFLVLDLFFPLAACQYILLELLHTFTMTPMKSFVDNSQHVLPLLQ